MKKRTLHFSNCFCVLLSGLLVVGCGGGDSSETAPPVSGSTGNETAAEPAASATDESVAPSAGPAAAEPPAASETPAPETPSAANATGTFSGTIVLDGEPPVLDPVARAGNEKLRDKEVCGKADVPDESLVVGENNGIANVFVFLRRAPKGFDAAVPQEPVVLDQKGCMFTPHVALIQAGQKVLVKSSDAVQHNVHTFPARNQSTNILINPNETTGIDLTYLKAETSPVQVKCDIHAWMSSYHLVLDHPFMAVTDSTGRFTIENLPAGDYQFRVWHEKGGLLEKGYKATVSGNDEPVELTYTVAQFVK